MLTHIPSRLDHSALAHVLFASPVQPSQCSSPEAIKVAVEAQLRACHGDPAGCVGHVAQEAGDRPDLYVTRMRWARQSVARAYPARQAVIPRRRCSAATSAWAPGVIRGAA